MALGREGLVQYAGSQNNIISTGKTDSVMSLESLAGRLGLYAVGAVAGLDGEITIFNSKPYITKVRGSDFVVDYTYNHEAMVLVWTEQTKWQDVPVPNTVKSYADLLQFVKAKASTLGTDVTRPFPFLLSGQPAEIKWHINVNRTEGKPITQDLFAKSRASYVAKKEVVDIIGFYSAEAGPKNAIHIHFVSRVGQATGHIDDLILGEDMVLRLPSP